MAVTAVNARHKFKAFQQNMEWFRAHYEELKRKYPNKFVAVYNGSAIDSDADSYRLINRLRRKHGDLGSFVIEPVSDGKVELLL